MASEAKRAAEEYQPIDCKCSWSNGGLDECVTCPHDNDETRFLAGARWLLERARDMTIDANTGEIDALNGMTVIPVKFVKLADIEKLFEEGERR